MNMRLKLFVILSLTGVYLVMAFGSSAASTLCASRFSSLCVLIDDGTDPPHAVDITGKVIPASSATQPDKPILLAKDSKDPIRREFKTEAAFDHVKHATLPKYSLDGKSAPSCVECHHTEQPSAPKQEYLKKFERSETLTAKELETSKKPVQSCRNCHLQLGTKPVGEYPPQAVKYPKSMARPATALLTNDEAYHVNCNFCHRAAKRRDAKTKAPSGCADCHIIKE
jgi:hypothetical protein